MISLVIELVDGETSLHSFARVYQSLFFLSREDLSPLLNYDSVTHDGDDDDDCNGNPSHIGHIVLVGS